MRMPAFAWVWLAAAVLVVAACEGKPGAVYGTFIADGSVTDMNLSGMGVPVASGVADPSTTYELSEGNYTVQWTANSTLYTAPVAVVADPPKKDNFLFFESQSDGVDRYLYYFFSGNSINISESVWNFTGTPY